MSLLVLFNFFVSCIKFFWCVFNFINVLASFWFCCISFVVILLVFNLLVNCIGIVWIVWLVKLLIFEGRFFFIFILVLVFVLVLIYILFIKFLVLGSFVKNLFVFIVLGFMLEVWIINDGGWVFKLIEKLILFFFFCLKVV